VAGRRLPGAQRLLPALTCGCKSSNLAIHYHRMLGR
jgi:hypothetical protein